MIERDGPLSLSRAVRAAGREPVVAVLPAEGGERRGPGAHAAHGRAPHGVSVLREPAADAASAPRGRCRGPAPDPAAHAPDGDGGDLPAAAHERGESGAPGLPLSAAGPHDLAGGPRVVRGHHLCPGAQGFFYVLAWRLSNTMDASFCVQALDDALGWRAPEILNTDQGSQFTSEAFADRVLGAGVRFSMDGRGRFLDNIFIERLWRSLKYEAVYLCELRDGPDAQRIIGSWIDFYNEARPHSSLGGRTPGEVYREGAEVW